MNPQSNDWVLSVAKRRLGLVLPLVFSMILLTLSSCARTTPPGPNEIAGAVEGGVTYMLLDWQEGLRIMIWDDIAYGGHYSGSTSSNTDPIFHLEGSGQGANNRGYEYTLETSDGLQADFAIDGTAYDLSQGTVFLVSVASDEKQVQQLNLDLSGMSPTDDGIVAFGKDIPEIAAFITENEIRFAQSKEATGVPELDGLAAAILSNDMQARRELVHYTTAGCTNVDGLGGPPKCQPGQADGTPVDYLPVLGPGEGVPVLPEAIDETLDFTAESLYAVFRRADEPIRDMYYPPGEYGLFFATGEGESNIQYVLVHADMSGRIVRLDYLACPVNEAGEIIEMEGLACSPEQIMERDAAELLLMP